ncbi:MAG: Na+/H+ antiporter [Deltaproteobacteria bacterium]|nr:Na+/H+ antiporter [Candidatus Zymogenaceae bacterium]
MNIGITIETQIVWLLFLASLVAIAIRYIRLPYTVALVLLGLVMGFFHIISAIHLTPEVLFFVFLPALLFEAAFHIEIKDFTKNIWAVFVLAFPGVVFTMLVVGAIMFLGITSFSENAGFTIGYALLFGSIVCATDPISVMAIFKRLGISKHLSVIIEGESLFNDGTAVVIFSLLMLSLSGGGFTLEQGLQKFFIVVTGGAAIGLALGFLMSVITAQIDDHLIEITLTTILAYGSYIAAEQLHVSGVIAVVSAGMMSGNFGTRYGMSPTTRFAVSSFWEYVVFAINSVVFVMIGIEISVTNLLDNYLFILMAWAAVIFSRAAVIYLARPLITFIGEKYSPKEATVLIWGGIRGSLSMVLVLSLPKDFPHRELILSMTFGVVFLTLIGQGMTMKYLIDWLKLHVDRSDRGSYEKNKGELIGASRAVDALETMAKERLILPEVYKQLSGLYSKKIGRLEKDATDLHLKKEVLTQYEYVDTRRHLLIVEKEAIKDAFSKGHISYEIMDELIKKLDEEGEALLDPSQG